MFSAELGEELANMPFRLIPHYESDGRRKKDLVLTVYTVDEHAPDALSAPLGTWKWNNSLFIVDELLPEYYALVAKIAATAKGPLSSVQLDAINSTADEAGAAQRSITDSSGITSREIAQVYIKLQSDTVTLLRASKAASVILEALYNMPEGERVVNLQLAVYVLQIARDPGLKLVIDLLENYAALWDHSGLRADFRFAYAEAMLPQHESGMQQLPDVRLKLREVWRTGAGARLKELRILLKLGKRPFIALLKQNLGISVSEHEFDQWENGEVRIPLEVFMAVKNFTRIALPPRLNDFRLALFLTPEKFGKAIDPDHPIPASIIGKWESDRIMIPTSILIRVEELWRETGGDRLREFRNVLDLTQPEFVKALSPDSQIPLTTFANWENKRRPFLLIFLSWPGLSQPARSALD